MVVRKKIIIIDGQEVEVPVFDTKITPGKEIDVDTLDRISKEEEIEKELQISVEKIKKVRTKYKNILKNLDYFYSAGKVLQFVDKNDYFRKQRGKIWQRMARDLSPGLFLYDTKKDIDEAKRYPEFMYLFAKVPKRFVRMATWDQWYEIMKFKEIYGKPTLLRKVLIECRAGISGPTLRERIKIIIGNKNVKAKN